MSQEGVAAGRREERLRAQGRELEECGRSYTEQLRREGWQVAQHKEIGSEKEKDEEKPTGMDFSIEKKSQNENSAPFQMEEERGFDEHRKSYQVQ
jgi:hypothetical protein